MDADDLLAEFETRTGWNETSLLHLILGFVEDRRLDDDLVTHLRGRAEEEDLECRSP